MRVMSFGTFDILHPGHESFLRGARRLGDHLIAVVARDNFVQKAKGRLPFNNERLRVRQLRRLGIADKVILGSRTHNWFRTLRTNEIDILALGYDQKPTVRELKKHLRLHRLGKVKVIRLRAMRPEIYKSSKLGNYS